MKRFLRGFLSCFAALAVGLCGMGQGLATAVDYSVSEKLFKQLQAGSGLTGTLTLSLTPVAGKESEAFSTVNPFVFDISAISVREDTAAGVPAERRYDVKYMDGDAPRATASFSLREGCLYWASTLFGNGWYALESKPDASVPNGVSLFTPSPSATDDGPPATALPENALSSATQTLLSKAALPSLYSFFLPMLLQGQGFSSPDLSDALAAYSTKVDLWIEGYRQSAVLGKAEDGTTTMEVDYAISPLAVKAQLKQMVMDLLADQTLLPKLQALLPEENSALLLNPALQNFYFFAIDSLPLEGNLTISRTVSLKGDTLALHLRLPLYDKEAGAAVIAYDRTAGNGDLPDENVVSLESDNLVLRLAYKEYRSMTDVTVYQGTLVREPRGISSYAVGDEDSDAFSKTLSVAFSLSHKQAFGTDDQDRETLTNEYQLSLEPSFFTDGKDAAAQPLTDEQKEAYVLFPAFDLGITSVFASKTAKNAATSMDLHLTLGGEEIPQTLDLTFAGKSTAKWTPDPIDPKTAVKLNQMPADDLNLLLTESAFRVGACFLPFVRLPQPAETPAPATQGAFTTVTPTPTPPGTVAGSATPTAPD